MGLKTEHLRFVSKIDAHVVRHESTMRTTIAMSSQQVSITFSGRKR